MEQVGLKFGPSDADLMVALQTIKAIAKKGLTGLVSENFPEVEEGKYLDLPLWAADILREHGFVDTPDEDQSGLALVKVLSRERLQPSSTLSIIPQDFYAKCRRTLKSLKASSKKEDYDRFLLRFKDLVSIRVAKILSLSMALSMPVEFLEKMALEERALYEVVSEYVGKWVTEVVGEGGLIRQ